MCVRRNHGKLLMSQEQVDRWCAALAKKHYMSVSDTHYAAIPREARGVPHYTVPGLHEYLDDYDRALENARDILDIESHRTVDSLQCLPFGPFSERQAPHVSEGGDPTTSRRFRNQEDAIHADGRAFQVDATCADVSIFREPLVPNVAITAPQDNIFAQAAPFVTTAFGVVAFVARQARTTLANPELGAEVTRPRRKLQLLHKLLCAFATTPGCRQATQPLPRPPWPWLSTCCFPPGMEWRTTSSAPLTRTPRQRSPRRCAQAARGEPIVSAPALPGLPGAMCMRRSASGHRSNADRVNAWCKLEPLILKLLEGNGSFDNDRVSLDAVWEGNDQMLRAATWMVASPDGSQTPQAPSPLAGVRSWTQVRAEHISPVFVGSTNAQGQHVPERASLVGIMPMGWQQILALLMAAPRVPGVVVQYAHNFGYLIYRPSAAPDILTSKNRERSSKAISVVNVEGDEPAFGTRHEKVRMCKLHRLAWRINLDLVMPICTAIAKPRADTVRARGDIKSVEYIKACKRDLDAAGMHTKQV